MKHTQGPWIVAPKRCDYRVDNPLLEQKLVDAGLPVSFSALAVGNSYQTKSIAIIPLDDSSLENAYLIASAPELFEALEKIANFDMNSTNYSADKMAQIAHKALAKAKGQ